jgi:hypothetical protein
MQGVETIEMFKRIKTYESTMYRMGWIDLTGIAAEDTRAHSTTLGLALQNTTEALFALDLNVTPTWICTGIDFSKGASCPGSI